MHDASVSTGMNDKHLIRFLRGYNPGDFHSVYDQEETRAEIVRVQGLLNTNGPTREVIDFARILFEQYDTFTARAPRRKRNLVGAARRGNCRGRETEAALPTVKQFAIVIDQEGYDANEIYRAIEKTKNARVMTGQPELPDLETPTDLALKKGKKGVSKIVPRAVRRFLIETPQPCTPKYDKSTAPELLALQAEAAFGEDVVARFDTWMVDGQQQRVIVVEGFPSWVDDAAKRAATFSCCKEISWAMWTTEREVSVKTVQRKDARLAPKRGAIDKGVRAGVSR